MKSIDEIINAPGEDNIVVTKNSKTGEDDGPPGGEFKKFVDSVKCGGGSPLFFVSQAEFHNHQRKSHEKNGNKIGNKKSTAAAFVNDIGKSPNVSKSHRTTDGGEQKPKPCLPFLPDSMQHEKLLSKS